VPGREYPGRAWGTDRAMTDEIGVGPVRPNDDQTNEKGATTMKLTTTTFVSVDGVMQGGRRAGRGPQRRIRARWMDHPALG
jgi:hypothetical protein